MIQPADEPRLQATRTAFDALAADYDRSEESNTLLLGLRRDTWQLLTDLFPAGSRLLDLGCGTGIDAVHLARAGCAVMATDISPAMIERTRQRAAGCGVGALVDARCLAIEQLDRLTGERFDGIYANRGPFNCVDDLPRAAESCARLLPPGGRLVATVIGRVCLWEIAYYGLKRDWRRAMLRRHPTFVSVPLQGQIVPTRYYTPREFYRAFAPSFDLTSYRGLDIVLPPSYLDPLCRRHPRLCAIAEHLDGAVGALPVFRNMGDLFLLVLTRRAA
jgi:SAM-dependent methyltransferase